MHHKIFQTEKTHIDVIVRKSLLAFIHPVVSFTDTGPPWSSLPMDLVCLVGSQVLAGDLLDYVRFRAAYAHWRSSTVCLLGCGIVDLCRWKILPKAMASTLPMARNASSTSLLESSYVFCTPF
jgi:hypothetical protein